MQSRSWFAGDGMPARPAGAGMSGATRSLTFNHELIGGSNNFGHANHMPFHPPPPNPVSPLNKHEILMKAGRLATEYLVARGDLPPTVFSRSWPGQVDRDRFARSLPDDRSAVSMLPPGVPASEGPFRRKFNDDFAQPWVRRNFRDRKRKFRQYKRGHPDWGHDYDRNGPSNERSRAFADCLDDDDEGAPGYRKEQKVENDEVGSSISGIVGGPQLLKAEAMGESELEDTGSKASSCSMNKDSHEMEVDDKKGSLKLAESETKHSVEPSNQNAALMDDDKGSQGDRENLMKFCEFTKVPTRPRSAVGHKSIVADQVKTVALGESSVVIIDGDHSTEAGLDNKVTDLMATVDGNQDRAKVTADETREVESEVCVSAHDAGEESKLAQPGTTEHSDMQTILSSSMALMEEGGNMDTVPKDIEIVELSGESKCDVEASQDEEVVELAAESNSVVANKFPSDDAEPITPMEEEKLNNQPNVKVFDLNLTGSPEIVEIPDNADVGHQKQQPSSGEGNSECNQVLLDDKVVQVIKIDDDSPNEVAEASSTKPMNNLEYQNLENMMAAHGDVLPCMQDNYGLGITDYLGSDISNYPAMPTDFQNGMSLNVSEGINVTDDPFYESLGDIGFMEVWDQQPQDYEKFF